MANKFYAPGNERAARVHDLFATIAPRYDLINDLQSLGLHRYWKRKLTTLACVQPGERALDLCCGTGDIAFALARKGASVAGLDFSEAMLAQARARASALNSGVEFLRGDAQNLPFSAESFDIVTVAYGLRNLASWQTGLEEMWRVARPGGRLLVLDFARPQNAFWRSLYFAYLRCAVPCFGRIFFGDPQTHAYIFESLKTYPAHYGVAEEMRRLNCESVNVINLLGGVMGIAYARKRATGA